jgi:hypothetical protein
VPDVELVGNLCCPPEPVLLEHFRVQRQQVLEVIRGRGCRGAAVCLVVHALSRACLFLSRACRLRHECVDLVG